MAIGTLTYKDAIAELKNPANASKYSTIEGLESLVKQISVQDSVAPSNARTYTYSGELGGGLGTRNLAVAVADLEGKNARIIDRTPASEFLSSKNYRTALELAFRNTYPDLSLSANKSQLATTVNSYMYDSSNGPWANRSAEFIETARGTVTNLTPNALSGRVWAETEFARELSNPEIREINGVSKEMLIDFKTSLKEVGYSDTEATAITRQFISFKSQIDLSDVEYARNSANEIVWTDAAVKLANAKCLSIPSDAVSRGTVGDLMGPLTQEKMHTSFRELQAAVQDVKGTKGQAIADIYEKELKIQEIRNHIPDPAFKGIKHPPVEQEYKRNAKVLIKETGGWPGQKADRVITAHMLKRGYDAGKIKTVLEKTSPELAGKSPVVCREYASQVFKSPKVVKELSIKKGIER